MLNRRSFGATRLRIAIVATGLVLPACQRGPATTSGMPATPVLPAPPASPASPRSQYEPSRALGQLFHDVQMARIYPDGKTFVDARPRVAPAEIVSRYAEAKGAAGFSLRAFVDQYFDAPKARGGQVHTDSARSMEDHIRALWPDLTRPRDTADALSSLIPLPNSYVVPGGRFREVYYWDSYFTMLGLVESGRVDLVRNMLDNFAHLIRTVGHIPNGNRTYYVSRSQPPYFAAMVGLYARAADTARALAYLDELEREYAFWMDGADRIAPGQSHRRVVKVASGAVLNRYWDDLPQPRPESYREDYLLAQPLAPARRDSVYRNLRAAAESGWDFSSRWMRDSSDLRTLETTDLIPVDLNSLLYNLERTIAALRAYRKQAGDAEVAARFSAAAERRRRELLALSYDPVAGFFFDVRWRTGERVTDRPTMAAAAPLYFGLATAEQGRAVAARLERDFLGPGGFVTTLIESRQQWDAPNGWAPLQWLAIEGVRRYGRTDLGNTARQRWLDLNRRVYRSTGKMTEKYDVLDVSREAGGGEYPTQDGFGWTNGVALKLSVQARAERDTTPGRVPNEAARSAETVRRWAPSVAQPLARRAAVAPRSVRVPAAAAAARD